jgi:hypothetical protein
MMNLTMLPSIVNLNDLLINQQNLVNYCYTSAVRTRTTNFFVRDQP